MAAAVMTEAPVVVDIAPWVAEIERRGGETGIFSVPYGKGRNHGRTVSLALIDSADGLTVDPLRRGQRRRSNASRASIARDQLHLIGVDGWRFYSRQYGSRRASLRYLVGTDDNGLWAVRVDGTVNTVREAMGQITPQAVVDALAAGRKVIRQGDVYAIETTAGRDGKGADTLSTWRLSGWCGTDEDVTIRRRQLVRDLGPDAVITRFDADEDRKSFRLRGVTGAQWDAETRTLVHVSTNPHRPVVVPFPCRFVVQSARMMGRGGRFGAGD